MTPLGRLGVLAANAAWFLGCVPGALAFLIALRFPEAAQRRLLRRTMIANRETAFGRAHGFAGIRTLAEFARVPVAGYEAFRDAIARIRRGEAHVLTAEHVSILQPTSGTSAAPKLIPLTRGLRRQFRAALAPWIASLYLLRPRLFVGRQYWCLSPNTRAPTADEGGAVPVGFADDTEYLGRMQQWFARHLLVAPPDLARITDSTAFEFLTQLFLVAADDLRLISVWHPSFLTLLIDALPRNAAALAVCLREGRLPAELAIPSEIRPRLQAALRARPDRADALLRAVRGGIIEPATLWPGLQIISCWAGESCDRWIRRLRAWFPGVAIQAKGLLATEGVVTIPWGFSGRQVGAVRSHVFEFVDPKAPGAPPKPITALQPGCEYNVILTTAGGLYRYLLGDRVRMSGWVGSTPCLEFLRRESLISDICGEKLTEADAAAALAALRHEEHVSLEFGMLVPDRHASVPGYVMIIQTEALIDPDRWQATVETALQKNFHYAHARQLGQLAAVRILVIRGDAESRARAWLIRRGLRHGDIKFPALRTEDGWPEEFAPSSGHDRASLIGA